MIGLLGILDLIVCVGIILFYFGFFKNLVFYFGFYLIGKLIFGFDFSSLIDAFIGVFLILMFLFDFKSVIVFVFVFWLLQKGVFSLV